MNEAQTAGVIQRWNIIWVYRVIGMSGRGKCRPGRTLTNDDKYHSFFFLPLLLLILISPSSLLHFSDQQGISSGGFSGGQRSVPPGSVALSALHCVWNHNVHLCHRRVDFLPVWKTAVKATLSQGYKKKKKKKTRPLTHFMNLNTSHHITCKCKIINLSTLSVSHVLSTLSWKS